MIATLASLVLRAVAVAMFAALGALAATAVVQLSKDIGGMPPRRSSPAPR